MYTKTFETVVKYRVLPGIALLLGLSPNNASAAVTQERASANLTYKYDFDVNPVTLDLDNNGNPDLAPTFGNDAPYIRDGKLVAHSDGDYIPQAIDSRFTYNGKVSYGTNLWETGMTSSQQEWTVEFKMKALNILYNSDSWFDLQVDPHGVTKAESLNIGFHSEHVSVQSGANNLQFALNAFQDNTFRVASSGGKYFLWLNGTLLNSGLSDADGILGEVSRFAYAPNTPGGISVGNHGPNSARWEMDYLYLDFTGAYAPPSEAIPEPASVSLASLCLAMLLLRRRRA